MQLFGLICFLESISHLCDGIFVGQNQLQNSEVSYICTHMVIGHVSFFKFVHVISVINEYL